jgi:ABC-type Fe3+/spermidine/putrescine transport system ATPase subunit
MHLALDSISMRYGDVTAVDELSLEVNRGELMTIIGPSGSGKSTILRIIAGLTKPDTGSILLDGNLLDQVPPHRRQLAMVFQDYGLFPHMNVSQNVAFGLEMRRLPREEIARRVRGGTRPGRSAGSVRITGSSHYRFRSPSARSNNRGPCSWPS